MDFRRLRYFVCVAEEKNFSRAAQKLHIAQPPLSMQIRSLEAELGVALFERHRPLKLTEAGQSLLADARRILGDVKSMEKRAREAGQGTIGTVNIGYIAPLANETLASILVEFRRKFPMVETNLQEMTSPVQVNALLDRRLDIGFMRPIHTSPDLHYEALFTDRLMLAVPSKSPLCKLKKLRWEDLRDVPLILLDPLTVSGLYDDFLTKCHRNPPFVGTHRLANDIHTALWLVSAGFGAAPTISFMRHATRPNVTFLDLPSGGPAISIVMARRTSDNNPAVKHFFDSAMGLIKKEPKSSAGH